MKRALQASASHLKQPHGDSDGPDLLRQIDVCARLGISDQTWMRWRKAGRTPAAVVLPSGRRKWRASDIDRLAGQTERVPARRRYFQSARRHSRTTLAPVAGDRPRTLGDRTGGAR